ncbi:hypothetical protein ND748_28750, partial [Frankia sp. AiPs1]
FVLRVTAARPGTFGVRGRPRPVPDGSARLPALADGGLVAGEADLVQRRAAGRTPSAGAGRPRFTGRHRPLYAGEADPVEQAGRGRPVAGRAGGGRAWLGLTDFSVARIAVAGVRMAGVSIAGVSIAGVRMARFWCLGDGSDLGLPTLVGKSTAARRIGRGKVATARRIGAAKSAPARRVVVPRAGRRRRRFAAEVRKRRPSRIAGGIGSAEPVGRIGRRITAGDAVGGIGAP